MCFPIYGHTIELMTFSGFYIPTGASLKVDGKVDGSKITSLQSDTFFVMDGGSLIIDKGRYMAYGFTVGIETNAADSKVEINGGYFQFIGCNVIYSRCKDSANPPQVVINEGTFIANKGVWSSLNDDVTKGTINGGAFMN